MFQIFLDGTPKPGDRNTIGGYPIFRQGQTTPNCGECGARMVFFFQLDIHKEYGISAQTDSHLLVFVYPTHNDIPFNCSDGPREPNFWEKERTFSLLLNPWDDDETHIQQVKS